MQAAAQLRQFYKSVFLDYYDAGPPPIPPPSPITVHTQLAIDPSLSNAITVLAYVLAFKFALEAFNTALPFISASLRAFSRFLSASRHLAVPLMFMLGIVSLLVLLAPFAPNISTLALFIVHGRDGGFSSDTRFLCPYEVDGTILQSPLSFSRALQFSRSHFPCMAGDGSARVMPMSFLLSYDAPSMLGRIIRLISFAVIYTFDRVVQSNTMRYLYVLFQSRIELPPVFHSVTDHFDMELLPVFVVVGLALYISVTLTVSLASCLMSGALRTVRVLVSKSVGSPRWHDGLVTFSTFMSTIFASCLLAIHFVWKSVIGRIISMVRIFAQTCTYVLSFMTGTARKDDIIDILLAKNFKLKIRLRTLSNRFDALKECVKDLRKMRAADQSNIRSLQHAADHALRQRDEVRSEASIATVKADALEAHVLELEATISRLQEQAAGWTQFERDVHAISMSAFAIQSTDVPPVETNTEAIVIAAENLELEATVNDLPEQTEAASVWAQLTGDVFAVDMSATAAKPAETNVTAHEDHALAAQNSEFEATIADQFQEQAEAEAKSFAVDMAATVIQSTDVLPAETIVAAHESQALATQSLELEETIKRLEEQTEEAAEWAQFNGNLFAVDISATQPAEVNVTVHESDALAAQSVELETAAKRLQEQMEEAIEWAQFERHIFAVDASATAIQPAGTNVTVYESHALAAQNLEPEESATEPSYVLPSLSLTHIHDVVPSIIFTDADLETEALASYPIDAASLSAATLTGTKVKTGSVSRLPRRALADITIDATKGTVKSQVKQTARKTHVEKENLRFGYRGT